MTINDRINELCSQAAEEGIDVDPVSLAACRAFFAAQTIEILRPRLTLTPDGTFMAHWLEWKQSREF